MLTVQLRNEHREIEKLIGLLIKVDDRLARGDLPASAQLDMLMSLFHDLVEGIHHGKEEVFLFKALLNSPVLRLGGPRCMYFSELRAMFPDSEKLFAAAGVSDPGKFSPNPVQAELIPVAGPLIVPLNDHLAGRWCLGQIRKLLDPANPNPAAARDLIFRYLSLMKTHISSEDECLFKMAESALAPADLSRLGEEALAWQAKEYRDFTARWSEFFSLLAKTL